jgi:hypothetical protein
MTEENASPATESSASTEAQGVAVESTPTTEQVSQTSEPAQTGSAVQQSYTPNYEFKAYDKVHQFPEWIRPTIKDKSHEDQLRDVFSRAMGFDVLKGKYEKTKESITRYSDVEKKYSEQTSSLKNLLALRDTDLGQFIQAVGLNDEMIMQHYNNVIRAKQDPEFAAQYNASLEARRQKLQATQEQESLKAQMEQLQEERNQIQLERHVSVFEQTYQKPDVQSFAAIFDQRAGKEGAFKDEAIDIGNYIYMKEKRYAPPQEVFGILMQKYGAFVGQGQQTTQEAVVPSQQAAKVSATIPNVGSGAGVSVTKPRFKSIDDIKKHYNKTYGE